MKNEKITTTLNLPLELLEECQKIYDTTNRTKAINNALADFLLMPSSEQKLDTFALHQLFPDVTKRKKRKVVSVRIPRKLFNVIIAISGCNTINETVTMMLSRTLYKVWKQSHSAHPCLPLLYVWGNKWDSRMQDAIENIKSTAVNVAWDTCVEPCAGGLGIYSNFQFADTEIMSDCDWNTINLYKAIQENPRELIAWARSLKADKATFEQQKTLLKSIDHSSRVNYEAASAYLFLNINSYKSKGGSPYNHMSNDKYYRALAAVYPLHQRLNQRANPQGQNTKLCNEDIFKVIEKYRKQEHVLFVIDPPYLDADLYNGKGNAFGEKEHKRLANMLRLVKQNNHNDFIYFCRITAPKRYQNAPYAEEYGIHMKACIDDLYYGHGFYYVDVELDAHTTERIITSFNFKGATEYGSMSARHGNPCTLPQVEMEVK